MYVEKDRALPEYLFGRSEDSPLMRRYFGIDDLGFEFKSKNSLCNKDDSMVFVVGNVEEKGDCRYFCLNGLYLYKVHKNSPLYNYMDEDRVFVCAYYRNTAHRNTAHLDDLLWHEDFLVFNRLRPGEDEVDYVCRHRRDIFQSKSDSKTRSIISIDDHKIFLVFKEDVEAVRNDIACQRDMLREKRQRENDHREQIRRDFENNIKISSGDDGNAGVLVDNNILQNESIRLEFTKPVRDIFSFFDILQFLQETDYDSGETIDRLSVKVERPSNLIDKINQFNCLWVDRIRTFLKKDLSNFEEHLGKYLFKLYVMDNENDQWELKLDFSLFRLPLGANGNFQWFLCGKKIRKQKIYFALKQLSAQLEGLNDFRQSEFEAFVERISAYTAEQLAMLKGRKLLVKLPAIDRRAEIFLKVQHKNSDSWSVEISDKSGNISSVAVKYDLLRKMLGNKTSYEKTMNGSLDFLSGVFGEENADSVFAILLNTAVRERDHHWSAVQKSIDLLNETIQRSNGRITYRKSEKDFIVKGNLKNYRVYRKSNSTEIGVETFPAKQYICLNFKTKAGNELAIWDKFVEFFYVLMNDSRMRDKITNLR